jgi:hypothetical protein
MFNKVLQYLQQELSFNLTYFRASESPSLG